MRSAQHLYIYDDDEEACTYIESYDTNDFKTSKHSLYACVVMSSFEYDLVRYLRLLLILF